MKQLLSLALALIPCLAWAQYPSNGNQKITLGEQTTADGLFYRGLAADTTRKPSVDTMAYMLLDTTTNIMWHYKKATSNAWLRLNLLPSDTASMLTNYYRSGRTGIIQASDVPTLNQNTTGSAATLTTSRTFQTNLASTSTASFNGSANVTPGVTGTLPVANGGTGSATQNFVDLTTTQSIGGAKTLTSALTGTSATFSGNVAMNTTLAVSNYALDVRGATNKRFGVQNSNSLSGAILLFYNDSNGFADGYYDALKMYVQTQSGNETIFAATTDNGAYNVQVNGTGVWGAGAYVNGSDINIKNNIENLDSSLNLINSLKPVTYKYNESFNSDEEYQIGFIAQDVYQNFENKKYVNSIVKSDGEILSMSYSALIPILTKAIQEQQALIKALEQRIINLENK